MLNIHFQVTIQKKWQTQNLKKFKSLKSSSQTDFMYFQTSCCNLKKSEVGKHNYVVFLLFLFWKELWRFKVKESILLVEQKYKV